LGGGDADAARLAVLVVMVQQVPSWDHGVDGVLLLTSKVPYVSITRLIDLYL
jgi:hypothetical protein